MTTPSVILNSGGKKRRARLYCRKSAVIFTEEHGYIAGRARLYCRKSEAIWRKSAVIFPEERGYIFVMKIVPTFVSACSQGQRTHSAQTNMITPERSPNFSFSHLAALALSWRLYGRVTHSSSRFL
jgi:hypothetical protein